ncbi:hypothetical protein U1Q18_022117 [Sarracenia purpurea var. burkii]
MVLSNKKLKQKLRAALIESLASSENDLANIDSAATPGPSSQSRESLKNLLGSAIQKPRLSKREKLRRTQSLRGPGVAERSGCGDSEKRNEEGGSEDASEKKGKRKRKRDEGLERDGSEVAQNVEEMESKEKKKKKKKMKKKKNKKKNKKVKMAENEELKEGEESGNAGSEQGVIETIKAGDGQETAEVAKKVYVGGIPYYSTEDDIRSYFEGCGSITEVDCMKFPESGKFRGIAIINFKTEAAVKRALALDGSDMGGLFLKIQPYKSIRAKKVSNFAPAIVEGYNRIYTGNLSWDVTEDELRKLFSGCNISGIRFGEDKETGEFRGYAHVDFADSLSLNMALKLDQEIVCGRPVRIRCAVPKKAAESNSKSVPTTAVMKEDNAGVAASSVTVSGKIRRRTCYECGEKGHLSSACPKKLGADPTDVNRA